MTAILYPVAETAEAALHTPRGFAAREREAHRMACAAVRFVTEPVGPAFPSQEAARLAYTVQGEGHRSLAAAPQPDWSRLVAVANEDKAKRTAPVRPVYRAGRRWPDAVAPGAPLWRLWVSYWRIESQDAAEPPGAARRLRRAEDGRALAGTTLAALARQPLRPVKLQQPLDFGLFEIALPEDPGHIIPDD